MNTRRFLTFLAMVFAIGLWSGPAFARIKGPLEGEPVVRKKLELRKLRLQVTPFVAMSLSQPFVHMGYVGGKLDFHILDWLAVRGTFGYGVVSLESQLLKSINNGGLPVGLAPGEPDTSAIGAAPCPSPGAPCRQSSDGDNPAPLLHDFRSGLVKAQWQSSVDVVFTPFAGKLGLFSAIFTEYDIYIFGGLGLVSYSRQYPNEQSTGEQLGADPVTGECTDVNGDSVDECLLHPVKADTGVKVGGSFGAGLNLMLTDWVGLNLEVQDIVVGVNLAGLNAEVEDVPPEVDNGDRNALHNVTLQLGARFYFPPKAKRTK